MKTIDKTHILKDMEHANKEGALVLKPLNEETWEEYEKCTFAFFPGCRLGAAEPEFVLRTYDTILSKQPDTAIFLYCCGFAAELCDEFDLRNNVLDKIKAQWESLDKPKLITSCATCAKMFSEYLPGVPTIMVSDFLNDPVADQIAKHILDNYQVSEDEKSLNRAELKQTLKDIF